MKPRLLIIHRALAPYRIELFNELYNRFDAHIYFEYPSPFEQQFNDAELQKRIHFSYRILSCPRHAPANFRSQLFSLIKDLRPQLILCSEINLITAILFVCKSLYTKAPLISLVDDNLTLSDKRKQNILKNFSIHLADGLICCDPRVTNVYTQQYRLPCHYLPIVQDEQFIHTQLLQALPQAKQIRAQYTLSEKDRILLFVGRLAEEKNLPALISAFSQLAQSYPRWHLLLVGDGPQVKDLSTLVEKEKLSKRIHIVGKKEGTDLYAHYAAADCFVLPSSRELFGAVTCEALMSGLPSLVSTVAGSVGLINQNNGEVFSPFETNDLTRSLSRMLSWIEATSLWQAEIKPSLMPKTFSRYMEELEEYLLSFLQKEER
ncbi:glycosyltransferase family 4 protein [Porphyromonas crevioricanis]|uniref:glycosyltransferase family 4 protein n=1 Tax=Porphyromonas crevioricanis TaxID=393921 RepID=UPI0005A77D9A|nr:glycosyltransferase family 4 protein [Porphyromonas crevioricanis]SJZ73450.1 Glycosyltransferase involved in cell wall bisynthesis [Porphyromonas crevioricanis]